MRKMKDHAELSQLAMRVERNIKERFPKRFVPSLSLKVVLTCLSPYTNIEAIMRVIPLLEVYPKDRFASSSP